MRKFILFLAVISLAACGQQNDAEGGFDTTGYETTKVNGTSVTHLVKKDDNGKILEEGYIKGGNKEGQWITYDSNKGSVTSIKSYINGTLNGYSFIISSRGYIDEQAGYLNGVLNGSNFKYRYGRPKSEQFYSNGQMDGIQKEYYDNGKIQQETEFVDGVQSGIYKYYSDDGILRMSYIYKDGEKVEGGMVEAPPEEEVETE